jgi:hypothetical protein
MDKRPIAFPEARMRQALASSEILPDEEIVRRRDEALRRALNTPPQPKHGKEKESNPAKPNPASAAKRGKHGQAA